MVDTALVGHLGPVPLAALAVSVVVFNLAFTLYNFLAYGMTEPEARRLSSGRTCAIPGFAVQALWVAITLGGATTMLALMLTRALTVGSDCGVNAGYADGSSGEGEHTGQPRT